MLGPHWLLAQPSQSILTPVLQRMASAVRQASLSSASCCFSSGLQTKHGGGDCGSYPLVLDASISHMDHLSAVLGKSLFFLLISFITFLKHVLKFCSVHYLVSLQYTAGFKDVYSVCRGEAMSCGLGSPLSP